VPRHPPKNKNKQTVNEKRDLMSDVFFKTRNMNNSSSSETKTTEDGSKTKEKTGRKKKKRNPK
jgi:hypothetical protein